MSYPLSVIKNPVGTFHFVGTVPAELAYITSDQAYVSTAYYCGSSIARKQAEREGGTFKTRTFTTEQEARDFAASLGFTVA
jgi:hypothetical protein